MHRCFDCIWFSIVRDVLCRQNSMYIIMNSAVMVYNSEIIKVNTFWAPEALAIDFFCPCQDLLINASTLGCCDTRLDLRAQISVMICVSLKNACSARIWNHHYIATVNMSHSVEIGVRSSSFSRIRANPIWRPQETHLYYDSVHQWTQDTVWNCEGLQVEKAFKWFGG